MKEGLSNINIYLCSVLEKIYQQLASSQLKDAVILMNAAKESFPDIATEKPATEEENEEAKEPVTMDTVACLKNLFMGMSTKHNQKIDVFEQNF